MEPGHYWTMTFASHIESISTEAYVNGTMEV